MVYLKAATLSNELRIEKEAWEELSKGATIFENSSMKCFIHEGVVISCSV